MTSKSSSTSTSPEDGMAVIPRDDFLSTPAYLQDKVDDKGWRIYFSNSDMSASMAPPSSSLSSNLVNHVDDGLPSGSLGFLYDYYGMTDETRQEPPSPSASARFSAAGDSSSNYALTGSSVHSDVIDIPERALQSKDVNHGPEHRHSFPEDTLHTFHYDNIEASSSKRYHSNTTFKGEHSNTTATFKGEHSQFSVKKIGKNRNSDGIEVETQSLLRVHLPPQVPRTHATNSVDKYVYTLEAQTSVIQRRDEDSLTYINKGQFYNLTFEARGTELEYDRVKSVVHLVFRGEQDPINELAHWSYWHGQQPNQNQRAFDVDRKLCTNIEEPIEEVGFNALAFVWNPRNRVKVSVCINCLSTDFSSQKGVKGIPLHLQIDTYENLLPLSDPVHRAFCQLKVFRDKGAERKNKDESKSAEKRMLKYIKEGQSSSEGVSTLQQNISSLFQGANKVTVLHSTAPMETKSIVFIPNHLRKTSTNSATSVTTGGLSSPTSLVPTTNNNNSTSNNNNNNNVPVSPEHRPASTDPPSNDLFMKIKDIREDRKSKTFRADLDDAKDDLGDLTMQPMYGAKCSRMIRRPSPVVTIYVRKEEEKAYNSIMLKILTVSELVNALASKYAIPIEMIKNTMKKTKKGLLVNFDDQMVEQFVDEDDFIISMDFDNQMGTVDLVIKY